MYSAVLQNESATCICVCVCVCVYPLPPLHLPPISPFHLFRLSQSRAFH